MPPIFKFANLNDISLIESAKKETENILEGKYSKFDIDVLVNRIDLEISFFLNSQKIDI